MDLFKGIEYLKLDIANSFGLDKKDWGERLQWFNDNEHQLMKLMPEAENHAQYFAGIKALESVKAGNPNTGYLISLDATSSGIQILSVLVGDRKAAAVSNVIDTGHRRDAYTDLYRVMVEIVKMMSTEGLDGTFTRANLKQAIMTAFYGSEAIPKKVFGEGLGLAAFFKTLETETPYVWEMNKAFLKMWDPTAFKHEWIMPDNFHVIIKVMDSLQETIMFKGNTHTVDKAINRPTATGRSIGANVTHSIDGFIVRELIRRCMYNPQMVAQVQKLIIDGPSSKKVSREDNLKVMELWKRFKESGYLSARILEHLNEENIAWVDTDQVQDLIDSLPKKPFSVLAVHDCFKVHPNYGNDLRKQYNLQLSLIAKSNMLSFVLSQLRQCKISINKQADFSNEILKANYALS